MHLGNGFWYRRGMGIFCIIAGIILICIFIPVWVWSLVLGISLIILGLFFCRAG
jgi:hypothetical protein